MCIKINRIVVLIFSIVFLSNTKADETSLKERLINTEKNNKEFVEELIKQKRSKHIGIKFNSIKDLREQMIENERIQNETALKNEENQTDDKKIITDNLSTEDNNNSNNANNETSPVNLEIEEAKSTCADIGFKEGTEKFGECVLKLYSRNKNKKKEMISKKKKIIQEQRTLAKEKQLRELEIQERKARLELMEKQKKALEQEQRDREWDAAQDLIDRGLKRGKYAEPTPPPPQNRTMDCIVVGDNMLNCY